MLCDSSASPLSVQLSRAYSLFSSLSPKDICDRSIWLFSIRPSLCCPFFNHLRSYGPIYQSVIDPPSSDEGSDPEIGIPSLRSTIDSVLDTALCETSDQFVWVEYHNPALILVNLTDRIRASQVVERLKDLCACVRKVQVVDFPTNTGMRRCGVVYIPIEMEAKRLYTKLKREEEAGILSARLNLTRGIDRNISVRWFTYKALDPQRDWTAVVLRNLDRDYSLGQMRGLLLENHISVLRIEAPRMIKSCKVSLVVTANMETAELICALFDKTYVEGNLLKVHIHPNTHVSRIHPSDSTHKSAFPHAEKPKNSPFGYKEIFDLIKGPSNSRSVKGVLEESPLKRLIRKSDSDSFSEDKVRKRRHKS